MPNFHFHRELRKLLSYVDTSKVCVWGWSFGGYLTGLLLAEVALRVPVEIYIFVSMMANIKLMNISNKNMRLVNAERIVKVLMITSVC